jgi:hypothetical protein
VGVYLEGAGERVPTCRFTSSEIELGTETPCPSSVQEDQRGTRLAEASNSRSGEKVPSTGDGRKMQEIGRRKSGEGIE